MINIQTINLFSNLFILVRFIGLAKFYGEGCV